MYIAFLKNHYYIFKCSLFDKLCHISVTTLIAAPIMVSVLESILSVELTLSSSTARKFHLPFSQEYYATK